MGFQLAHYLVAQYGVWAVVAAELLLLPTAAVAALPRLEHRETT
jgi:hypothetical protein